MDICAESQNQRVIIENKVYSGLNGIKADETTQLTTYYNCGNKKRMKPLCFVVAPDFRINEIKSEIEMLDSNIKDIYLTKSYGDIADLIEEEWSNS